MKHKRDYLASFDLQIIVCLCYKMIYNRDTLNRKSHLSHTWTCWFFIGLPQPHLRYLKTQINIKGGMQTSLSFVQISISIPEPISKQSGNFGWLFRKKYHRGLLFFFKNWQNFLIFMAFVIEIWCSYELKRLKSIHSHLISSIINILSPKQTIFML